MIIMLVGVVLTLCGLGLLFISFMAEAMNPTGMELKNIAVGIIVSIVFMITGIALMIGERG